MWTYKPRAMPGRWRSALITALGSTTGARTQPIFTWTACRRLPPSFSNRVESAGGLPILFRSSSCLPAPGFVRLTPVLLGLFPELNAPGGIQRAGRHLAFVMSEYAASHKMEYRFLSLNDTPELHRMRITDREFVFTGADRGKARFAVNAMRAARRHAKLVLAAHPNLGPLIRPMRLFAPRMKNIVCTHGIEVWEPLPSGRRNALRRATLVLAPSRATRDHLVSVQGVASERVRVLPWALDPDFETKSAAGPRSALPSNFTP